jgi:hypothetical protein
VNDELGRQYANFKALCSHLLRGSEKSKQNLTRVGVSPNRDLKVEPLENQEGEMVNLSRSYVNSFLSFITVFTDLGIVFESDTKSRHKDVESTRSSSFWALARLV